MNDSSSNLSEQPSTQAGFVTIALNLVTAPSLAFKQLQQRPQLLIPMLLIISVQVAVIVYYYQVVDLSWMMDQVMARFADNPEVQQRMADSPNNMMMGRTAMTISGAVGAAIVYPAIWAAFAVYFVLVSLTSGDGIKFKQWYCLVCWCSLPVILRAIASLVTIMLSSNGQIGQEQLNPLSLNNLFFGLHTGEDGVAFLSAIDLISLWCMTLTVIGYQSWSQKSWGTAAAIVLAPYLIFYGIFAFFSFR